LAVIPEKSLDLFQKRAFAQLATLMPDGSPQVTTVWVDYDGRHILINTVKGHLKDKNMRRDPRVGLDIVDPENPYRHLSVRGLIVWTSQNRVAMRTSTGWPRNTSTRINILAAARERYESSIRSSPNAPI
jgi:PPOX class probable F420-dependent enzyme